MTKDEFYEEVKSLIDEEREKTVKKVIEILEKNRMAAYMAIGDVIEVVINNRAIGEIKKEFGG